MDGDGKQQSGAERVVTCVGCMSTMLAQLSCIGQGGSAQYPELLPEYAGQSDLYR